MEPDKASDMKWFQLDNLPDKLTITTKKALADYKKISHIMNFKNNKIAIYAEDNIEI